MSMVQQEILVSQSQKAFSLLRAHAVAAMRRVWLILVLATLWEVASRFTQSLFIPPPSRILAQFVANWMPFSEIGFENLTTNAAPTIVHMLAGWLLAGLLGIGVGLVLGRARRLQMLVKPLIAFGMNVPPPALLPLAILLFGFSSEGILFLICFGAIWPILINTLDAAHDVEPSVVASSRVLHFGKWLFFSRVLLPTCSPRIVSGMRIALGLSLIFTVIAEMYGATSGIGKAIVSAQRSFQILDMWAGITMLAIVGVALNRLFLWLERRVLRWQIGLRQGQR